MITSVCSENTTASPAPSSAPKLSVARQAMLNERRVSSANNSSSAIAPISPSCWAPAAKIRSVVAAGMVLPPPVAKPEPTIPPSASANRLCRIW